MTAREMRERFPFTAAAQAMREFGVRERRAWEAARRENERQRQADRREARDRKRRERAQ